MKKSTTKYMKGAAVIATAACVSGAAHAELGWKAGEWDLAFSGNVNAFYVHTGCDSSSTVVSGAVFVCQQSQDTASVQNGFLPAALVFSANTRKADLDVGVKIGFYPGLADQPASTGFGVPKIDARQLYMTLGNKRWGSVKLGRDYGLFAVDATFADMHVSGLGAGAGGIRPGYATFGRVGVGYMYMDWQPQISYFSPNYGGFEFAAGIFQPMETQTFGVANSATARGHDQPQLQAKASYAWSNGTDSGKIWSSTTSQKHTALSGDTAASGYSYTGTGIDIGGKVAFGSFELVASAYDGDGIGTTALFTDSIANVGGGTAKRKSNGGYLQATYKVGDTKLGLSHGESRLKLADGEAAGTQLRKSKSDVLGVYHSLNDAVQLVGEYIDTRAENQSGGNIGSKTLALGAILFF